MLTHCAAKDTQQEIFIAWCLIFIACLIESHAEKFPIHFHLGPLEPLHTVYSLLETNLDLRTWSKQECSFFFILGP